MNLTNPFEVSRLLQDWGYRSDLETRDGRTTIYSGTQGDFFYIDFYWCEGPKSCSAMMFFIEYDTNAGLTLEDANDWNGRRLMGRMSIDENCDLDMSHFVVSPGVVPVQTFATLMAEWNTIVSDLQDLVSDRDLQTKGKLIECGGKNVPI